VKLISTFKIYCFITALHGVRTLESIVVFCFIKDRNVYRYYRDLINFRQKGDPAVLLRCVNPAEAKLIDAAAGIHVKFRLAGVSKPQ